MQVNIPNVGVVNFPDSMSPEEVHATISNKIWPQAVAQKQQQAVGLAQQQQGIAGQMQGMLGTGLGAQEQQLQAHEAARLAANQSGFAGAPATPFPLAMPGNQPLPPPTTSGMGNPALAALGLSQAGPVVASGMEQGAGKFLVEQLNAQNLALGAVLPPVLHIPGLGRVVQTVIGAQGAEAAGQALGTLSGSPDAPRGEKNYLLAKAGMGGLMTLAAPGMAKTAGASPKFMYDLIKDMANPESYQAADTSKFGFGLKSADLPQKPTLDLRGRQSFDLSQPNLQSSRPAEAPSADPSINKPVVEKAVPTSTTASTALPVPRDVSVKAIPYPQGLPVIPGLQFYTLNETIKSPDGLEYPAGKQITSGELKRFGFKPKIEDEGQATVSKDVPSAAQPEVAKAPPASPVAGQPVAEAGQGAGATGAGSAKRSLVPAIRTTGGKVLVVGEHDGGVKLHPGAERGFTSNGQDFYKTPLEAARAVIAQQENKNERTTTSPQQAPAFGFTPPVEEGQKVPGPQGPVQEAPEGKVPGTAGRTVGQGSGVDVQGVRAPGEVEEPYSTRVARRIGERQGEAGFFRLGGGVDLSPLGLKDEAKVQGEQFVNRVRNVLGADSGAFKYLEQAGLGAFLKTAKTVKDLRDWMLKVEPVVKVKKLKGENITEGLSYNPTADAAASQHALETQGFVVEPLDEGPYYDVFTRNHEGIVVDENHPRGDKHFVNILDLTPEQQQHVRNVWEGTRAQENNKREGVRWDSVAPKNAKDMPGYVELVLTRPHKGQWAAKGTPVNPKFNPTNHFPLDANALAFVRGYMEIDPKTGEKTFHIIEVQSDWEAAHSDAVARQKRSGLTQEQWESTEPRVRQASKLADPLLPYYERLAMKAAIEHAKKEGATKVAVQDAESAMMQEGHDLAARERTLQDPLGDPEDKIIPQEQGMRLHYDQTLPKIAEELTGAKGERVDFGEHKMALKSDGQYWDDQRVIEGAMANGATEAEAQVYAEQTRKSRKVEKYRPDLIFKNLDGSPKTSVTARSYDISKTDPEKFTTFGKDKPASSVQKVDKTRMTGESGSIINPFYGIAERVTRRRANEGEIEDYRPGIGAIPGEALERGRQKIAEGVDPERVLAAFNADPEHATSETMMGIFFAHGENLKKAADAAEAAHGIRSKEYKAAAKADSDWIQKIQASKTATSRQFVAQQGEVDVDTGSFHSMARDLTGRLEGQEPSDAQLEQIKKFSDGDKEHLEKIKVAADLVMKELSETADKLTKVQETIKTAKPAAKQLLSEAAKHGMKGTSKAFQALNTLFGTGQGKLGSFGAFDETTWAKAKPIFQEAWNEYKAAGGSLKDFADHVVNTTGEHIRPYVEKFVKEMPKLKHEPISGVPGAPKGKKTLSQQVWDHVNEVYIKKGERDFEKIRHGTADALGLSVDEVTRIFSQSKNVKALTDEMYGLMDSRRKLKQSAELWLKEQTVPKWQRAMKMVPRLFFLDKIFGHGTVGMITHAGLNVFDPAAWNTYVPSFLKQYRMAYVPSFHERWVQEQVRKPLFNFWKRAGLKHDPYQYPDDYQNAAIKAFMGKYQVLIGGHGFDALKDFRINRANQLWDQLPENYKYQFDDTGKMLTDKDGNPILNLKMGRAIADAVNHATGVVDSNFGGEWASYTFFAPKLEASRWAWTIGDPARALATRLNWAKASQEEKQFAIAEVKQKARIVGVYMGLLALNQGYLSLTDSKQKINGLPQFMGGKGIDPRHGDFLAFKVAGKNVGIINPMIGIVKLFAHLVAAGQLSRTPFQQLNSRRGDMGDAMFDYASGKLSPMAGFGLDVFSQQDFAHRPLPWSDDKPNKGMEARGLGKLPTGQYVAEKLMPIPFEEAVKEVWADQGMNRPTVNRLFDFFSTLIAAGGTGARVSPDWDLHVKPKPEKNKFEIKPPKPPKAPKPLAKGEIIERGGKNYAVVGHDTDGEPLVESV